MQDLERAWDFRLGSGVFEKTQAVRVFHGPGEGTGDLETIAIDRFGDHYWVTHWEGDSPSASKSALKIEQLKKQIVEFLQKKGAKSGVSLDRPERGIASELKVWFGHPPESRFEVREGDLNFWIQFTATRHPGLFLDHFPLRQWLLANMNGLNVLNTFAYTGSLSVAAAVGGAKSVTTLDLSKPVIQWAKENALLNRVSEAAHSWISGDVFEWLPRFKKKQEMFDCIILDPPSFSHGNKGSFSTAKDLGKLHALAIDLLKEKGFLITSINSGNVSREYYENSIFTVAQAKGVQFQVIGQIDLPSTFPTRLGRAKDRYLKGWILRREI